MIFKKLLWTLKRHPFLYLTRFRLLSRNTDIANISGYSYNIMNRKEDIPKFFYEINKQIFKEGKPEKDFEIVKTISSWLDTNIKGGPGLSEPSDRALHIMLEGNGGVCSDMAQIFNNFCVINDISVREWGTTTAPFNRDYGGHSFNEVYCADLSKWILIDVSWSFLFYNEKDVPLSVIEMYELKRNEQLITYKSFIKDKIVEEKIIYKNYLNSDIIPFLICDYRNNVYDKYLAFTRPYVPVFITHFYIFLLQKSYHYRFPLDNYKKIFS